MMSVAPPGANPTMMRTGSRRIGLRPRDARYRRQRGGARGQMQELAAGKFHFEPPSRFTSLRRRGRAASAVRGARLPPIGQPDGGSQRAQRIPSFLWSVGMASAWVEDLIYNSSKLAE